MTYELRRHDEDDKPLAYTVREGAALADVLGLAEQTSGWVDVYEDGRYLVTSGWYWWPTDDGGMHQIGSHGWCHDCHKDGLGYVHHLDYATELAVLAYENATDRVARRMCEADGQTPEQAAAEVAGRAVPLHGDESFATDVHELGADMTTGLAWFAVDMWDMTTWRVSVPVAEGAPRAARELAEERAYAAQPKRCYDCKGRRGHARDCGVTREREFCEKYPELAAQVPFADPLVSAS